MWTVVWKPSAEQHLAAIWLAASDRAGVTAAANRIDRLLATDPEKLGHAHFDTVRIFRLPPLGVEFEVIEQDRLVWVLAAWDVTKFTPP
jgi:plasmid stabilization system protein ParE